MLPPIDLPVGSKDYRVREASMKPSKEEAIRKHQSRLVVEK